MKQRVYTIGVGDQVRLIRASNRRHMLLFIFGHISSTAWIL